MDNPIHIHYSCGCHGQPNPKVELMGDKLCVTIKFKCQVCGRGTSQELVVGDMSISAVKGCPPECKCDSDEATAAIPLSLLTTKAPVKRKKNRK